MFFLYLFCEISEIKKKKTLDLVAGYFQISEQSEISHKKNVDCKFFYKKTYIYIIICENHPFRTADSENRLTECFFLILKTEEVLRMGELSFFRKNQGSCQNPPKITGTDGSQNSENRPTLVYCWSQTLFP
jgi:hypothetical protein